MGKGEIAHYEQFLFFPQRFQKTNIADMRKQGLVWERVKYLIIGYISCVNQAQTVQNVQSAT